MNNYKQATTIYWLQVLSIALFYLLLAGCASQAIDDLYVSVDRTLNHGNHIFYEEEGTTELMIQSVRGDIEKVKLALDSGADPNQSNVNGYSALMFAAEHGNVTISKMLIDYGADVGMKNKYGHTPLFVASNKRMPNRQSYLEAMEWAHISYVGEGNHTGVINYLMSIDAPIYESLVYASDAEFTGWAFFNIAQIYARTEKHASSVEYLNIAIRGFLIASQLEEKRYQVGKKIETALPWAAASFVVVGLTYEAYFNREVPYQLLGIDPQMVNEALQTPQTDRGSDEYTNIYLISARNHIERARAIGLLQECYTDKTPDDVLDACFKQATKKFDEIDE